MKLILILILFFQFEILDARNIRWNYDGNATLIGNGCNLDQQDTLLVSSGDEFSIIFSKLNLSLDEGDSLASRVGCRGMIPVDIGGERLLAKMKQTISFGWAKTAGSTGRIKIHNRWFGNPIKPLIFRLKQQDKGTNSFQEVVVNENMRNTCVPRRGKKGVLLVNITMIGKRNDPDHEAIDMAVFGQDFKYSASTTWEPCRFVL